MLEVVYLIVSYAPVDGICHLCIIIAIAFAEGLIIFFLGISNTFQNIILPNHAERIYISLQYIYLN